jgi:hypothetical protein
MRRLHEIAEPYKKIAWGQGVVKDSRVMKSRVLLGQCLKGNLERFAWATIEFTAAVKPSPRKQSDRVRRDGVECKKSQPGLRTKKRWDAAWQ